MRRFSMFLAAAMLASGCSGNGSQTPQHDPIEVSRFIDTLATNLSTYQGWVTEQYLHGEYKGIGVCLSDMKLSLATEITQSDKASAGATLALLPATVGPSFSFIRSETNKTNYDITFAPDYTKGEHKNEPKPDGFADAARTELTPQAKKAFPFAAALFIVRQSIIASFGTLQTPDYGAGFATSALVTTFTFSVTKTEAGEVNIGIGPVSLGGGVSSMSSSGNIAVVSFAEMAKGQRFCGDPANPATRTAASVPPTIPPNTTVPYNRNLERLTNQRDIFQ